MTHVDGNWRPTWSLLVRLEPRLLDVLEDARSDPGPWEVAYALRIKPRVQSLVGWGASGADPRLKTSEAYEVAIQTIADALP